MKIKSVSGLNGNEVLAEPILTNENIVLIPKGTVLKEEYIPLIQSLEIETLMRMKIWKIQIPLLTEPIWRGLLNV